VKKIIIALLIIVLAMGSIPVQAIQTNQSVMKNVTLATFSRGNGSYRIVSANGPVGVKVYDDDSNKLVAEIADKRPQEIKDSSIISSVEDSDQVVYLPPTANYRIELLATDDAMFTFTIMEYSGRMQTINRIVSYFDVPIKTGETFITDIPTYSEEDLDSGSSRGSSTVYKLVDANANELQETISLIGDETSDTNYRVDIYTEDGEKGVAFGWGRKRLGRFVEIWAYPQSGYAFEGWYVDNEKISDKIKYYHRVEKDIEFVAKFKPVSESEVIWEGTMLGTLIEKINEVKEATSGETVYTSETWRAFSIELQKADEVAGLALLGYEETEKSIEEALEKLTQTFEALEIHISIDKAALLAKIKETEELEPTEYTDSTWEQVEASLKKARILSKMADMDVDTTQQEVDDMLLELEQALNGLALSNANTADIDIPTYTDITNQDIEDIQGNEEIIAHDAKIVIFITSVILTFSEPMAKLLAEDAMTIPLVVLLVFCVLILIFAQVFRIAGWKMISREKLKEYLQRKPIKIAISSVGIVVCITTSIFLWGYLKPLKTLGELAYDANARHGYTIYIEEETGYQPYLVVTRNYGEENHVLLLRTNLLDEDQPFNQNFEDELIYENSSIDVYLNEVYLETLGSETKNQIQTTTVNATPWTEWDKSAEDELPKEIIQRKVFLLSNMELGTEERENIQKEEPLQYFMDNTQHLLATYKEGAKSSWLLRTGDKEPTIISSSGRHVSAFPLIYYATYPAGIRPAFCLDGDIKIVKNKDIIAGETVYMLDLEKAE